MMTKFNCTDVVWDTETDDGVKSESFNLPTTVVVELDSDDVEWAKTEDRVNGSSTLDEMVVNALSEKVGWLVQSFKFEEVK